MGYDLKVCAQCGEKMGLTADGRCKLCKIDLCCPCYRKHELKHFKKEPKKMTREEKLEAIRKHQEKDRAESPDGMTAWERVEKYRKEHDGKLPPSEEPK